MVNAFCGGLRTTLYWYKSTDLQDASRQPVCTYRCMYAYTYIQAAGVCMYAYTYIQAAGVCMYAYTYIQAAGVWMYAYTYIQAAC